MEALAALLERYRPSLYAAAIRLLRSREDALDAVQETCVVALALLGALRDPEAVGVRAQILGIYASNDLTILEIDFTNPAAAPDHCPPRSTFVHHLAGGLSTRLDIHYV